MDLFYNHVDNIERLGTTKMRNKLILYILFIVFAFPSIVNAEVSTLYDSLKKTATNDSTSSEFVESETGIDFSEVSSDTNGKGLYMIGSTINDKYPIIYYRGNINNNNVLYAGFCWKIIRSTSTGGLKLLYSGLPNEGKCNNVKENLAIGKSEYNPVNSDGYYGWMYNTEEGDKNSIDSSAKKYLDEWFKNNMLDHVKELEDTVWCNDRTFENGAFDARTRLENGKPTLECKNKEDSFTVFSEEGNKKLTYPTAIINADEVTYAGEVLKKTQTDTFINIGYSYWSMTPYTTNKNMYPNSKGMLNMYTFTYLAGIRPMVSVRNTAVFYSGDGTSDNPYSMEVEKQYRIITDEYTNSDKVETEVNGMVTLSYENRDGYKFVSYKITDLDDNELDITINDNKFSMPEKDVKVISVYRELKTFYNVSTTNNIIEITESSVEEEQPATFKVNLPHGYKTKKVIISDAAGNELDINIEENDNEYTFEMPNKDIVLDVEIEEKEKHAVTGDVDNLVEDPYYIDDKVEFNIYSNNNQRVSRVYLTDKDGNILDIEVVNNNGKYSFSMPNMDVEIHVDYETINPKTADNIMNSVILFIISFVMLIISLLYLRIRKNN